jgi:uncharacterized membrane protein YdbT with pleckstrin-like domain
MGLFPTKRTDEGYQQMQAGTPVPPAQTAHVGASASRAEIDVSPELMAKHEESRRKFPGIHLSKGEYIIVEVRRHPIGLVSIWALMLMLVAITLAVIPLYDANVGLIASVFDATIDKLPTAADITMPILALAGVFLMGGLIAVYVYNGNLFYLTNESIIQFIQNSIFSTKEQQINLVNVDDVSYKQQGILQQVLHYGTVRISTEGDERNPYVFYLVANPQVVTRTINDAMEEATGFAVRYRQHKQAVQRNDPTLPPPEVF